MSDPIPQDAALRLQLACIAGHEPSSSFFEIRPLTADGRPAPRVRAFVPIRQVRRTVRAIRLLAPRLNVYVAAAPRVREDGTAESIERVWCLWTDVDGRDALKRLRDFRPSPTLVIRSGSPDCAHAYWALRKALTPQGAQRANRRLALALGGDMNATDPARILRPAGTLNHKSDPPAEVICTRCRTDMFSLADVVGQVPDDPRYLRPQTPPGRDQVRGGPNLIGDPSNVIAGLARTVREAPVGNRNRATFWAACRIAEHADAGIVDEIQAVEEIRQAALDAGLPEHEVMATIRSGLSRRTGAAAA